MRPWCYKTINAKEEAGTKSVTQNEANVRSVEERLPTVRGDRSGTIRYCFPVLFSRRCRFFACKSINKRALSDPVDRECLEKEPKVMSLLAPHPHILQIVGSMKMKPVFTWSWSSVIPPIFSLESTIKEAETGRFWVSGVVRRGKGDERSGRTPYYVAPEVLSGIEYTEKVDVWSAGVILYVMLAGVPPFYGDSAAEIFEAVLRGNLRFPTRIFRTVSPAAKDLLRKMICKDVSRRLSAEQALNAGEFKPFLWTPMDHKRRRDLKL
ncbi:Phosphoenolpyruvate carboxylase kinase 1 [Vitis vinifera]|uniref:Phosphoenolpyruvate carboxylase kinase 1 n=1 Tax=Vitis vinifera TaxID=29760 RepID=A0A438J9M2_VITVI|nr:Phosphoenolpyruvate carboxylase kinase 1 [Vitis vinifera]